MRAVPLLRTSHECVVRHPADLLGGHQDYLQKPCRVASAESKSPSAEWGDGSPTRHLALSTQHSALNPVSQRRIEDVAQPVADPGYRDGAEHQDQAGKGADPPGAVQVLAPLGEHA